MLAYVLMFHFLTAPYEKLTMVFLDDTISHQTALEKCENLGKQLSEIKGIRPLKDFECEKVLVGK